MEPHALHFGLALQAVAANGYLECVSVVHCDVGLLERGRQVRRTGANIAVADIFDAGAPTLVTHFACPSLGRWPQKQGFCIPRTT